jgi:hypothetical protein
VLACPAGPDHLLLVPATNQINQDRLLVLLLLGSGVQDHRLVYAGLRSLHRHPALWYHQHLTVFPFKSARPWDHLWVRGAQNHLCWCRAAGSLSPGPPSSGHDRWVRYIRAPSGAAGPLGSGTTTVWWDRWAWEALHQHPCFVGIISAFTLFLLQERTVSLGPPLTPLLSGTGSVWS